MKFLSGEEEKEAMGHFDSASRIALNSTCQRARCGTIIVKDSEIIGKGFNSPPAEKESQRKCNSPKDKYHQKVTDKTCCVHAEQRAIIDAMRKNPEKVAGSRLYFIRLDEKGALSKAGKPYCTHCSKLALDAGVKEFALWHEEGICVYNTEEYNTISFEFKD